MLYLALGTNLGDRAANLAEACRLISQLIGPVTTCSDPIETSPAGFVSPHRFLNAAATVNTSLPLHDILDKTQQIERTMGRTTKSHDGIHEDRIIDIDLLFYDDLICHDERLTLPHPRLHLRRFVLEPLCQIAPDFVHPLCHEKISVLLSRLNKGNISRVTLSSLTPQVLTSINHLLPQLSQRARPLTEATLQQVVSAPSTHLFVLRDEESAICAMATLSVDYLPTGTKSWIEDVVTDTSCRGRGYARQLIRHLVSYAQQLGADSVNLTSRPSREAANRLYRSEGFKLRETNVYKMELRQLDTEK